MSIVKLNPQIREVQIGIKELRPVKIYPLSMSDQFKMTDIIRSVFEEMNDAINSETYSTASLMEFVLEALTVNLPTLLKYACPEDEVKLEELTNYQFTEIVGHVYKDNFEDAGKNVKNLVEKVKTLFPSARS